MNTDPILAMRGIEKWFPGVRALAAVDLDVRRGEVHALMGQNGAGKSTLIKVLTGAHRRDGGRITFEGRDFRASSPADAQRQGISTIYQEVNLVPTLSVAENLFLGRMPRRWFGVDWRAMRRRARAVLAAYGLHLDVDRTLGSHPVAVQQLVGIARAIDTEARLLVMDEPTSSLDQHETEVLFGIIRRLKGRGLSVIFITHFLDQVFRVSDRITVLRNGARVGTFDAPALWLLDAWKNITTPPKDLINICGGTGLRPVAPIPLGVRNEILIKFRVYPDKVWKEPGVKFDITRQKEGKSWIGNGQPPNIQWTPGSPDTFPNNDEAANDDLLEEDESKAPNGDNEMFVSDGPGTWTPDTYGDDYYILRWNLREYMRVRFDGQDPAGNGIAGSRCSGKYDWHVRHRLVKDAATGKWKRDTGDAQETETNDVAPEHKPLGDPA